MPGWVLRSIRKNVDVSKLKNQRVIMEIKRAEQIEQQQGVQITTEELRRRRDQSRRRRDEETAKRMTINQVKVCNNPSEFAEMPALLQEKVSEEVKWKLKANILRVNADGYLEIVEEIDKVKVDTPKEDPKPLLPRPRGTSVEKSPASDIARGREVGASVRRVQEDHRPSAAQVAEVQGDQKMTLSV